METLCCEFIHSVVKRILPRSHWRRDKTLGSTKVGEKNKYSTRQCHKTCHKTIFDGMTEIQISVSQFQWAQTFHICLGVEGWLPTGEINWTGPWRMKSEHPKVSISLCWFSVQSEDEDFFLPLLESEWSCEYSWVILQTGQLQSFPPRGGQKETFSPQAEMGEPSSLE